MSRYLAGAGRFGVSSILRLPAVAAEGAKEALRVSAEGNRMESHYGTTIGYQRAGRLG